MCIQEYLDGFYLFKIVYLNLNIKGVWVKLVQIKEIDLQFIYWDFD